MTYRAPQQVEPLDVKEIVSAVDAASHLLAHAAETLLHVAALFQGINAATSTGTLAGRLSRLGEVICDDRCADFIEHRDTFYKLTERFTAEINVCAEVRNG